MKFLFSQFKFLTSWLDQALVGKRFTDISELIRYDLPRCGWPLHKTFLLHVFIKDHDLFLF